MVDAFSGNLLLETVDRRDRPAFYNCVKVEMRKTTAAGANTLTGRVKYATCD